MPFLKKTEYSVIVKDTFELSGRGTVVIPEESLPFENFGREYNIFVQNHSSKINCEASVESLLLSASRGIEIFTYYIKNVKNVKNVKKVEIEIGATITIISEL